MLTRRLAILALVATLLPTFLVPGRIAVCLGDCGCRGARAEAEGPAEVRSEAPCCCCCPTAAEADAETPSSSCRCGVLPGPEREDRPSCPDCAVFERGFGEATGPEAFAWSCPEPVELVRAVEFPAPRPLTRGVARVADRDPRDPPPRPAVPLRL